MQFHGVGVPNLTQSFLSTNENKISTNSNVNCKSYWRQHNIQRARTTLTFIFNLSWGYFS